MGRRCYRAGAADTGCRLRNAVECNPDQTCRQRIGPVRALMDDGLCALVCVCVWEWETAETRNRDSVCMWA